MGEHFPSVLPPPLPVPQVLLSLAIQLLTFPPAILAGYYFNLSLRIQPWVIFRRKKIAER